MALRSVRVRGAVLCAVLAASSLQGCQLAYDYEVRGRVKSASDGAPLAGVRITLEAGSLFATTSPAMTATDGTFSLRFTVSDGAFGPVAMPKWSLTLAKEGYFDELIDISPTKEPESAKITNQIFVVAYMRTQP
jgi:hypothetical protein